MNFQSVIPDLQSAPPYVKQSTAISKIRLAESTH